MKTKIYGASDDLIIIEGVIDDEVGCFNHKKPIKIEISDGTCGSIFYDRGEWKINISFAGREYLKLIDSVGDENDHFNEDAKGCASYSDILILDDGVEWVKIGSKIFKATGQEEPQ